MDTAVSYAVDEQLRVEALRAAVSFCVCLTDCDDCDVLAVASKFEAWLLGTVPATERGGVN